MKETDPFVRKENPGTKSRGKPKTESQFLNCAFRESSVERGEFGQTRVRDPSGQGNARVRVAQRRMPQKEGRNVHLLLHGLHPTGEGLSRKNKTTTGVKDDG